MPSSVTSSVISATLVGVDGHLVTVEVHVGQACPAIRSSGCPTPRCASRANASAPRCCRPSSPGRQKRVTVNLAPGGLRKTGAGFELAVALGIAVANEELPAGVLDGVGVLGELGLDGSVRPSPARSRSSTSSPAPASAPSIVPIANAAEAALVDGVQVRAAQPSRRAARVPQGRDHRGPTGPTPDAARRIRPTKPSTSPRSAASPGPAARSRPPPPAATTCCSPARPAPARPCSPAGSPRSSRHSTHDEALEVTRIHSAAGHAPAGGLARDPPVPGAAPHRVDRRARRRRQPAPRPRRGHARAPGRALPRRARRVPAAALDALRQPLEERVVRISRQPFAITFPADFQLVACSNPCPCGLGPPRCTLLRRPADALPPAAVRATARPVRPPARRAAARNPTRSTASRRRSSASACVAAVARQARALPRVAVEPQRPRPAQAPSPPPCPSIADAARRLARPDRGTVAHRTGRGPHPARRPHARRPRRRGDVSAAHVTLASHAPRGRAVTATAPDPRAGPRAPRRRSPGFPDMTPARLRALVEHFGGPVAAACGRSSAASARSTSSPARDPTIADRCRASAATWSAHAEPGAGRRTTRAAAHAGLARRRRPLPDPRRGSRAAARAARRRRRPTSTCSRPRGSRSSAPAPRPRTGSPTRASSARTSRDVRHHGRQRARHRHRRRGARGRARRRRRGGRRRRDRASTSSTHAATSTLYRRVREAGLVLGETGFGVRPTPKRFPVRNRIIAALADVVVVVEATLRGRRAHHRRVRRASTAARCSRCPARAATRRPRARTPCSPTARTPFDWSDVVLALGLTPASRRATPNRPTAGGRRPAVLARAGGRARLARPAREPHRTRARGRGDGDRRAGTDGMGPPRARLDLAPVTRHGRRPRRARRTRPGPSRFAYGGNVGLPYACGLQPLPHTRQAANRHRDHRRRVRGDRAAARLGLLRLT